MVCERLARSADFPAESGVVHAPTSEALRAYMLSLRDGRCFLTFNWFPDFPKGGQSIGGVSNGWNYVTGCRRSKTSTS
jgi:hypothetical protein